MMSLRLFAGMVAAVVILVAGAALFLPINVAESVPCGTAASLDTKPAFMADHTNELSRTMTGGENMAATDHVGDCRSAAAARKTWAIPLAGLGVIVLAGAVLVRTPQRRAVS